MKTCKREFLDLCMRQDVKWLRECADNPSQFMRPVHVSLVRIAIRKKISLT